MPSCPLDVDIFTITLQLPYFPTLFFVSMYSHISDTSMPACVSVYVRTRARVNETDTDPLAFNDRCAVSCATNVKCSDITH